MNSPLVLVLLVGVVAGLECPVCQEVKVTGTGAEAISQSMASSETPKCSDGKTAVCNEANGENACLKLNTKINMVMTTPMEMNVGMDMTMKMCGPAAAADGEETCKAMTSSFTEGFKAMGESLKMTVENCDITKEDPPSSAAGLTAGIISAITLILHLL